MSVEIYVSTDVEVDGPIPGPHSILSIGSAAYGADGRLLATFSANLEPLPGATQHPDTMAWWAKNPAAWTAARVDPQSPATVMQTYAAWLKQLPGTAIFVGYPAGFDLLTNASNMLDVTQEAPDGTITPLDGYLDGYFQEIYLDAASAPIFNKLVKQVSSDSLDDYIAGLNKEVTKYFGGDHPNYGKAAKRLYNVFRLSGQYEEAAFLRELFDEPAALLYQVYSLMRTV